MLENMDELAIGMYKILEPKPELRDAARASGSTSSELDLVMVPGVAFDRTRRPHGARHRLLRQAAGARPARCAAGGAGVRVPDLSRDSHAGARHLHGQDHHRAGGLSRAKGGKRVAAPSRAEVEDTYAEAFRSIYAEVLITARDRTWLDHAVRGRTGNASSTILCDCEAGLDRYVGPGGDESFATPDGRPGAIVQFHVPRFRKDRVEALERSLLVRISQNVLTCPTTACFNLLDTEPYFKLGRKIAFFGDGYQFRDDALRPQGVGGADPGRRVRHRPPLRLSRRPDGRQLWFMGDDVDAALLAAERAAGGRAPSRPA